MSVVANLVVRISALTTEFEKGMSGLSKSLNRTGRELQSTGTAMTKGITVPLVAIGGLAAKAAIEFESSFAGIRKTVDGIHDGFGNLNAAGLELRQGMRDLSKEMPISVNELNKIGEAAGQLGIGKDDVLEFTKIMAMLGATTNLTSDQAATSIAQIQNIFGAAGKDTANFASTLVALGNAGASTEAGILDLAQRISVAGNQVGLSEAQTLGWAASIRNLGIEAEKGGTSFSKFVSSMSVAVDTGGAKLKKFADLASLSIKGPISTGGFQAPLS